LLHTCCVSPVPASLFTILLLGGRGRSAVNSDFQYKNLSFVTVSQPQPSVSVHGQSEQSSPCSACILLGSGKCTTDF
jgi:hypothetical protein